MLNNKWFFLTNKLNTYTNSSSPANHIYVSPTHTQLQAYLNSSHTATPVDITACCKDNQANINLISKSGDAVESIMFRGAPLAPISVNSDGLLWSVREVLEFFGSCGVKTTDTRNLLLDYSANTSPLLKTFPVQGDREVYFNFYSQQVAASPANFIEL